METILIFSDIHANLEAFEKVVSSIDKALFTDSLKVFLGDYVNFGPWPQETISMLRSLTNSIFVIGNHDLFVVDGTNIKAKSYFGNNPLLEHVNWTRANIKPDNMEWLAGLNQKVDFNISPNRAIGFHGNLNDPESGFIADCLNIIEAEIIMCGHIHMPYIKNLGKKIILNPGSVGEPLDNDTRASYMKIENKNGRLKYSIERIEYNIDKVESEMNTKKVPLKETIMCGFRNGYINK
jgi:putative phosphoesterase